MNRLSVANFEILNFKSNSPVIGQGGCLIVRMYETGSPSYTCFSDMYGQ